MLDIHNKNEYKNLGLGVPMTSAFDMRIRHSQSVLKHGSCQTAYDLGPIAFKL